ncbi:MAG: PaaI family thioesterase [Anaerolineales bacterium]
MPDDPTPDINDLLRERAPEGIDLLIPPPCFTEMGAEVLSYTDGEALRVRFPAQHRYANPLGNMQGGFIIAAIDNTIGPLSYLVAPPSVTTQLNTTFMRPVTPRDEYIEVEARLTDRTNQFLYFTATAYNTGGKELIRAYATHILLRMSRS